ncbi:MAG: hypothetical protein KIS92_20065 [Planctomycetota bacterium]|nr:hypothetical protein [Planctomycetota bacterium]
MIPIDMTEYSGEGAVGNCYQCCLASILELPLAKVPHFYKFAPRAYTEDMIHAWLSTQGLGKIGLDVAQLPSFKMGFIGDGPVPQGFCILSGPGPRTKVQPDGTEKNIKHAVVGLAGRIIHDPHPSRAGLLSIETVEFLIALHPDRVLRSVSPCLRGESEARA